MNNSKQPKITMSTTTAIIYSGGGTLSCSLLTPPYCDEGIEILEVPYKPIFIKSGIFIEFNANGSSDDMIVCLFDKLSRQPLGCYVGKHSHSFSTDILTGETAEVYSSVCLTNTTGLDMMFSLRAWTVSGKPFSINKYYNNREQTFIKIYEERRYEHK